MAGNVLKSAVRCCFKNQVQKCFLRSSSVLKKCEHKDSPDQPQNKKKQKCVKENSHDVIATNENSSNNHSEQNHILKNSIAGITKCSAQEQITSLGTIPLSLCSDNDLSHSSDTKQERRNEEIVESTESLLRNSEYIDSISPPLPYSFNIAAFLNRSESLQQLVHLGVDLSEIEKKADQAEFLVKLDFEKDMKNHIQFLSDLGVPAEKLGFFLTKNPLIFKEHLDDLQVRINYLKSKKFKYDAIAEIITRAPKILSLNTLRIDQRLGYLQKTFKLNGNEVRLVVTSYPKIVLLHFHHMREVNFSVINEMGFSAEEIKQLLLKKPKIWKLSRQVLFCTFDFVHNKMGISHSNILQYPGILLKKLFVVKQRHMFLVKLGRAQYDPSKPGYVSLESIVMLRDPEFCTTVAKSSIDDFNTFLKML